MVQKKVFHKSKTFYIVSGIVLILFISGILVWRNYKYKLVNQKLDNLVTGKSRGLYDISYHNLVIDEVLGNISVENLDMLPDTLVYQSMVETKTAPDDLFFIRIPRLQITGVKTPKALLKKEIRAHIIRLENAEIEIRLGSAPNENKPDFSKYLQGKYYHQLLGKLNSIQADSIVLENARLTLTDRKSKQIKIKIDGLSIRFAGTLIDSTTEDDSTRILYSKELAIHCNQAELPSKNKEYHFSLGAVDYNSQTESLHIAELRLKPLLTETAFAQAHKFAKDRFDISVGSLELKHIGRQAMLHEQLVADSLLISGASFRVFRNKSIPHDSVDRTHDYPQEAIMSLPVKLNIRKLVLQDSYIEYKEKNDKSDSSGKVAFHHVSATLDNVTNMPEIIRLHHQMVLHFKASFLNETSFSATMNMRLNDQQGHFTLDAQLGSIQAKSLNPLLKPMALAELEKGDIKKLIYHMDATNTHAKGKLTFIYEDLSVKLLKKDEEKNKYKTKVIPTLAAGFLLRHSNPQDGKTISGNVDYTRDIHRSIFNLMWKSMFSGIKQIAL